MIAAILFSIIGLALISIPFIYAICNVVRNNKKIANEEREHQEQLNSICSGTILKRVREINENPFKIYEQKILIRGVKTNTNGEKWIKYSYQDIFNKNVFSQSINYAMLKYMLETYPIIELPKN